MEEKNTQHKEEQKEQKKKLGSFVSITAILLIGVVVIIIVAFVARDSSDISRIENEISRGSVAEENLDRAPDFTLEDYNGNQVSLADSSGKVRVVNTWATWCPFCVDELPDFAQLQEEFGDQIVVISIDRAESLEQAKEFTDGLDVTDKFTFLLDPRDSFYKSIGGFSMPETLFIDGDGNIRIHKRGPMRFEEMKQKIESILAVTNSNS